MYDYKVLQEFLKEYQIYDASIRYDRRPEHPSVLECSMPLYSVMRMIRELGFQIEDEQPKQTTEEISYIHMMGFD